MMHLLPLEIMILMAFDPNDTRGPDHSDDMLVLMLMMHLMPLEIHFTNNTADNQGLGQNPDDLRGPHALRNADALPSST